MKIGDQVGWQWDTGVATGEILEIHPKRTQIQSHGRISTRNGSDTDPAVVIRGSSGSRVLKLAHEIQILKGGDDVQ